MKVLNDEEVKKAIVDISSRYLPECRVYLFGSRARGNLKTIRSRKLY